MAISVLKAVRSDVPVLAGLAFSLNKMTSCFLPSAPVKLVPNAKKKFRDHYRKVLASKNTVVLKAVDCGKVVGFLECRLYKNPSVFRQGIHIEVKALFVLPEYRKHGIGSELFAEIFKWAKMKRAREIELSCWSSNAPAMKFYQTRGFAEYRKVMKKFL
ncbi:GNAT family N-acetyltransferase [Candidatus Micrarchaeota archaeon]|nr:GNAT family N-acetyltransferase [Candidatus Micrarchaeota archaeon]